ncbi:MAG: hypothetical protein ACKVS9_06005 [Phycisphaerae bacterium]
MYRIQSVIARALSFCAVATICCPLSFAADVIWSNAAGGRWGDAANWTGGVVPSVADNAIITLPVTVAIDDNRSVGGLSVASGSTLQIRGNNVRGHATLTLSGVGTNQGIIQLDSSSGSFTGNLSVTGSGILNNAPAARIELLATFATNRGLFGTIRNQGTIFADAAYDASPQRLQFSGGQYLADGGVLQGAFFLVNRELQTISSPPAASTIRVATGCSISSDVQAGYTVEILGTAQWGHAVVNVSSSVANRGVIRLGTLSGSYYSQLLFAADQVLTNESGGELVFAAGLREDRYFSGNLINAGTVAVETDVLAVINGVVAQQAGSISAAGKWRHDSGSFTFTGGTTSGNVYCSGVALDVQNTVTAVSSLLAEGVNTLVRNDSPVVTITLEGNVVTGHSSLRMPADATNRGVLRLTTTSASFYAQLLNENDSTLTNAATGLIELKDGAGQSRYVHGKLVNRGRVVADSSFDTQPNRLEVANGTYVADGGTLEGAIYLRNKTISTAASPAQPSIIRVAADTNVLTSDVFAGYSVEVYGTLHWGHGVLQVASSVTNRGRMRLGSENSSFYSQIIVASGAALTNAAGASLEMIAGVRVNRYFNGSLVNAGTIAVDPTVLVVSSGDLLQQSGSFSALGKWQQDSGSMTISGGVTGGNVYASGVTLVVGAGVTSASSMFVEGVNTFVGNASPQMTITCEGNGSTGHAVLRASADATNRGDIRLDSTNDSFYSQVLVDPGMTLTNESTGEIRFVSTAGQSRYLTGTVLNRGAIVADDAFDVAPQRVVFTTGEYIADGGTISGAVYCRDHDVRLIGSPAFASVIRLAGPGNRLLTDAIPGYELELEATAQWGNSVVNVPASISNFSEIRLSSSSPNFYSQIILGANQLLTNAPNGLIRTVGGNRQDRYISGSFHNDGVVHVDSGTILNTGAYSQSDMGAYEVELGGTAAGQFSRWAVSGNASLDGKLRITRVGGFTPILGDRFQIMTFNSFSDRFSCNDIEGIFVQGNLRFSLERNPTNLTLEVVDFALLPTDPDCDCEIDLTDLANVLVNFGTPTGMQLADGDFDGNGAVDLTDLALLLSNFGTACP